MKGAEMKKPADDLGWKILNEYIDRISSKEEAANFEADARLLEGAFTSGFISEEMYRSMLNGALSAYEAVR